MICERCHGGQTLEYERQVGRVSKITIRGTRCRYFLMENDDDVWSAV